MSTAEQVFEGVKRLPEPLARQVLDFVEFLAQRDDRASWVDLRSAQASSLHAVWDNDEDKVWDDL